MSEAVRSYSTSGRTGYDAPSTRGGFFRRLILAVLVCLLVWLFWTTRDTYPIERLVPRDQNFHLQAEHLLASRLKVAGSPLWNLALLPEKYKRIPEWLGNDFGLPDWVLNNLVSDVCYVSGKDFSTFSDLLVVTRMSRVGCLIERYHGFMDGIEDEYAGGLHLRRMEGSDTYYAVRGRTLAISPSRDALIAALSQREAESVETLEDAISATGGDVQGSVLLREGDPLGRYFDRADFVLTFSPDSIVFACRGIVQDKWRSTLEPLSRVSGGSPNTVPEVGALVLSGNFGAPIPEVYRGLDGVADGALGNYLRGHPLAAHLAAGEGAPWSEFATGLAGEMGSSFTLRWIGFDTDGAVPLPVLELALPSGGGGTQALLGAVPAVQADRDPAGMAPYRNPENGVVHLPVGWGGIVEPVIAPAANGVRIALHPAHLDYFSEEADAPGIAGESGQLNLRVRPAEALEILLEGGQPYARAGLIRGHTQQSFEQSMAAALEGIRALTEARVSADYSDGALSIEISIALSGPPPAG